MREMPSPLKTGTLTTVSARPVPCAAVQRLHTGPSLKCALDSPPYHTNLLYLQVYHIRVVGICQLLMYFPFTAADSFLQMHSTIITIMPGNGGSQRPPRRPRFSHQKARLSTALAYSQCRRICGENAKHRGLRCAARMGRQRIRAGDISAMEGCTAHTPEATAAAPGERRHQRGNAQSCSPKHFVLNSICPRKADIAAPLPSSAANRHGPSRSPITL